MENITSNAKDIERAVRMLLKAIGENPDRTGLQGTPDRVARMFAEIYRGYDAKQAPKITTFPNGQDGLYVNDIVIDRGDYYSTCEHHMMPFFGRYMFAYIPSESGKILGISKVGRVVDFCAARLQIQERLSRDIVEMINDALCSGCEREEQFPRGIAIIMQGEHLCKSMRGVKKRGTMQTIYAIGELNTPEAKKQLMQIFNNAN